MARINLQANTKAWAAGNSINTELSVRDLREREREREALQSRQACPLRPMMKYLRRRHRQRLKYTKRNCEFFDRLIIEGIELASWIVGDKRTSFILYPFEKRCKRFGQDTSKNRTIFTWK